MPAPPRVGAPFAGSGVINRFLLSRLSIGMVCAFRRGVGANNKPLAAVEAAYARIGAAGERPTFIHVVPREVALARAGDPALAQRALCGLTFAVKDNIDVAGLPTTAACPAFSYVAERSATVVEKLVAAGAILVGKTNMDQFAAGLVGTRSPYGICRNAFDERYISGGSSSGSAIAVAKGFCDFALGTDTAGSGRVPAAFNNLVGLKPTRGRVSTAGVVPACRTLDCVSIFSRTVDLAARVVSVLEGEDAADPFSRRIENRPLPGPRLAVPRQLEFFGDREYARLFRAALAPFDPVEIDFAPFLEAQALLYEGPWLAERLHAIEHLPPAALHPVTRRVLDGGKKHSALDAFRAQYRLVELKQRCDALWREAGALVVPGAPTIYTVAEVEANPIELNSRLGWYTNFVNLLDYAAITVPAGFRADGLPFGVTFIAPAHTDRALAALAARFLREPEPALEADTVPIAVVGAHLTGMPLNHELTSRGAKLARATRTAPRYRLHRLSPHKPGLVRASDGAAVDVEVWEMPVAAFGSFVAAIPPPLAIGTIELEDGALVKGFVCEHYAVQGQPDITSYGGWRNYLDNTSQGTLN